MSAAGDVWAQPGPAEGLAGATAAVAALRADLIARSTYPTLDLASVHATHRQDAENLLQYLELRHRDMRELQARLADLGLSSLGRSEGHVLATVDAVLRALRALADSTVVPSASAEAEDGLTFAGGRGLLAANTDALLGPSRAGRETRIMVTLPGSAADDYPLIRALVERGMDCARINCAHDDATAWEKMIAHVRLASRETGRQCSVAMDLAGPKLRTGPVAPGPAVARLRPQRDAYGRVTAAAACWLVDADSSSACPDEIPHQGTGGPPTPAQPATSTPVEPPPGLRVSVPPAFIAALRVGDQIRLRDARGARRRLRVTAVASSGARVEADQTIYLATGMPLHVRRGRGRSVLSSHVGALPPVEQFLRLRVGDRLLLTRDLTPAQPPKPDETAHIGCTLPEVFGQVAPGHRVWFDDGKIGAIVATARPAELELRITDAPPAGARLRAGKGINLPDTDLPVSALTAKDKADLGFVAANADIVSLSFVRRPADIEALHDALVSADRADIGVILKIETLRAFENLPQLLLTALRHRRVGVMIARGDLAVECGYERLAELQEEILWLCEAAHVPVIWATQVLDQLARTGRPTRAEITDAAMAERAECVMLNKGPHITDAVILLDDVLTRMADRQRKNAPLLDELRWTADTGETAET